MRMIPRHRSGRRRAMWIVAAILGAAALAYVLPPAMASVASPQNAAWVVGL
jgi:hypothetical protein